MDYFKPIWALPLKRVKSLTTYRYSGNSSGAFDSLNLAFHVKDDNLSVAQNRAILNQSLDLPDEPFWLNQTHSTKTTDTDDFDYHCDSIISFHANQVCSVMTADCLPIFLTDVAESFVAVVHAGWRGLCDGIIENTINNIILHGIKKEQILAAFGPAIGPCCFEVGAEVKKAFCEQYQCDEHCFYQTPNKSEKYLADIYKLAGARLERLHIGHLPKAISECTVCSKDKYFSYRRDKITGRMASLIWLQGK